MQKVCDWVHTRDKQSDRLVFQEVKLKNTYHNRNCNGQWYTYREKHNLKYDNSGNGLNIRVLAESFCYCPVSRTRDISEMDPRRKKRAVKVELRRGVLKFSTGSSRVIECREVVHRKERKLNRVDPSVELSRDRG